MDEDSSHTASPPYNDGSWCSWYYLSRHWKVLLGGQLLSFLLATGGAAQATLHLKCSLSAPSFTMSLVYLVLSFHLGGLFCNKRRGSSLNLPLWQYLLIALSDVQANAMTVWSFRYTTLTSITLFDALAIPSSMMISKAFLKRRYTPVHLLGVILCVTGVVLNVWLDYQSDHQHQADNNYMANATNSTIDNTDTTSLSDSTEAYPHKLRGDLLAMGAGILYGVNDVVVEAIVRHNGDTTEYLGVVGFLGFVIGMVQALVLEWDDIAAFFVAPDDEMDLDNDDIDTNNNQHCSVPTGWLLTLLFVASASLSYMGGAHFLMASEAAYFNLSLLTGDLYSVLFSVVAQHIVPHPLFFGALLFVFAGLILYEMAPSPVLDDNTKIDIASNIKYDACAHHPLDQSDHEAKTKAEWDETTEDVMPTLELT